ncbi:MAG: tRNA (adenosine(37)-N6)-threonylcarbamoyltransferase complex dimerization subunit type 1 TsaB [Flavobacteriales bacterium]|nr:tRNA (adenosine(37)-N6)-threonylcarbamoyltransferase complex dimerization subunit type 1 TsaB [Flavobacteriales bacterium]MCX7767442.1 tRNA (adenosine(37)-N6)-threonylcarbamoyltransferase complex dimerization subunit type 1 TsaB [Flavobacteriales bacterium]MDW8410044.1 tRNA (adenosine(37)-N6)-threonylcarbamoyltransferase complex dimerization subunit type 1 TsaB [Flavobacteriales bacterium]
MTTNPSPALLALETSGAACGVALAWQGHYFVDTDEQPLQHATRLAPMIRQILEEAGASPSHLQAVAVSLGPGSYTGLRIGLATAKGLCQVIGCPLIGISTFQILRLTALRKYAERHPEWIVLAIASKRDYLYLAAFNKEGNPLFSIENYHYTSWDSLVGGIPWTSTIVVGSGAQSLIEKLKTEPLIMDVNLQPEASEALELALEAFQAKTFVSLHDTEPLYLSGFQPLKSIGSPLKPPSHF